MSMTTDTIEARHAMTADTTISDGMVADAIIVCRYNGCWWYAFELLAMY